jgi:hypothetical protein
MTGPLHQWNNEPENGEDNRSVIVATNSIPGCYLLLDFLLFFLKQEQDISLAGKVNFKHYYSQMNV